LPELLDVYIQNIIYSTRALLCGYEVQKNTHLFYILNESLPLYKNKQQGTTYIKELNYNATFMNTCDL